MMQELNYIHCDDYYLPDIRLGRVSRSITNAASSGSEREKSSFISAMRLFVRVFSLDALSAYTGISNSFFKLSPLH